MNPMLYIDMSPSSKHPNPPTALSTFPCPPQQAPTLLESTPPTPPQISLQGIPLLPQAKPVQSQSNFAQPTRFFTQFPDR